MQFPFARKLRKHRANMHNVFLSWAPFHAFVPRAALISLAMALSQHGSLPNPAADTYAHFLGLPRCPHTLQEASYTGGLLMGDMVEWAKGSDPSPTLIHIDMTEPERKRALCKKGWATNLWQQLQLPPPPPSELRAIRFIPHPKRLTPSCGSCLCTGRAI